MRALMDVLCQAVTVAVLYLAATWLGRWAGMRRR